MLCIKMNIQINVENVKVLRLNHNANGKINAKSRKINMISKKSVRPRYIMVFVIAIYAVNQLNRGKIWNIDHIHPVSRGGTTVPENLRPVHCDCNQAKQHLTLDEFRRIQNLCKNR